MLVGLLGRRRTPSWEAVFQLGMMPAAKFVSPVPLALKMTRRYRMTEIDCFEKDNSVVCVSYSPRVFFLYYVSENNIDVIAMHRRLRLLHFGTVDTIDYLDLNSLLTWLLFGDDGSTQSTGKGSEALVA